MLGIDKRHLKLEIAKQRKYLNALGGVDVKRAQSAALNKTAKKVKSGTAKATASKTQLPQKHFRKKMKIKNANAKTQLANIKISTTGIPLSQLNPKVVPGGVQAGKYLVPDGFIATTTRSPKGSVRGRQNPGIGLIGKTHVFKRKTQKRYKLKMQEVNIRPDITRQVKREASHAMSRYAADYLLHEYKWRIEKKLQRIK